MKKLLKYQFVVLLMAILAIQYSANAQTTVSEKVVLSTDRELYLSGEKLLFYARVFVDGDSETQLSNILYLELFKNKKAFVQAKFRIEDGKAEGFLKLPIELLSGNYYLRAYTMQMRNGEPENYFNTLIKVVNPERKLHETTAVHQKIIEVVPEGGSFVAGLENNTCISFNYNSHKEIVSAIVVNSKSDTLSNVNIFENGLGEFTFTPKGSEEVWIKIALKSGDSAFVKLNNPKSNGYFMRFDKSEAMVNIFSKGKVGLKANLSLFNPLFEEVVRKDLELSDTLVSLNLTNIEFEAGVNYLVLKDNFDKVLLVYPFFIEQQNVEDIMLDFSSSSVRREKVELKVNGCEADDFIMLSVVKKGMISHMTRSLNSEFIFNPILLNDNSEKVNTSDFEIDRQIQLSFVLNQNYFNSTEFKSKFSNEKAIIWLPEIRDLSLSGKVKNSRSGEPLTGIRVFASVLGEQPQLHSYLSNEDGDFIFSLNQLEGTRDVALTMDSIENSDAEIVVLSDFSSRFPTFRDYQLQLDTTSKKLLDEMYRNFQIAYKFEEIILDKETYPDSLPFPFQDVQASIVLDNFIELPSMQEVINEIVTYVSARKRGGRYYLNVLNVDSETLYDKPLVLIDNLPVFNIDKVMKINPSKVEKIEVITKPYSFGEVNFKGIVMITTKTDNFGGLSLPNETIFLRYSTSSLSSKQVFPEFSADNNYKSNLPYFSNTIYWNADNTYDENETNYSFYTSDEAGTFDVIIRVISKSGEVEQTVKTLMVE